MHDRAVPAASEPVEAYLDQLLLVLAGPPRQVRHTLAEIEAHLYDAVAEELAGGRIQAEAETAALARFGPVQAVTGRAVRFGRPGAALARRVALAAALIGGVALIAVGVSGVIARLLAALGGGRFVSAPFPPGSYTRADCARWLAGDPGTRNCVTAMVADHVNDILLQSLAGGLAGLLLLAAYWWMRRRWQDRSTLTSLPAGSAETAGAILAGLVTIGTLAAGVDAEMVQAGQGAGHSFSLAAAALGAAAFFSARLCREVRPRPAAPAAVRS
jgi:hypothetical protein